MIRRLLHLLLLASGLILPASAFDIHLAEGTNTLVWQRGDPLEEETFLFAPEVDFQGRSRRDVWFLAPQALHFRGESDGDVRALAGSALFSGKIRQNLMVYARGVHLTTSAVIRGEAALLGETVICEGQLFSNALIFAQSATIGGRWDGNLRIYAEEIQIVPGTTIAGDLIYSTSKPLVWDSSVVIGGTARSVSPVWSGTQARSRLMLHGYLFLSALLVGLPFVNLFPLVVGEAVRKLRRTPWRVLLTGLITLFLGPLLAAFAFFTLVGIPFALLLGGLIAMTAYLSHIIVALWLGHVLLRPAPPYSFARVLAALVTGLFVIYFAGAFPAIAAFLWPPVLILGTGALVAAILFRPLFPFSFPPLPQDPTTNPSDERRIP